MKNLYWIFAIVSAVAAIVLQTVSMSFFLITVLLWILSAVLLGYYLQEFQKTTDFTNKNRRNKIITFIRLLIILNVSWVLYLIFILLSAL